MSAGWSWAIGGMAAGALLILKRPFRATPNSDPNTFDRTLVTVHNATNTFTFAVDDLNQRALFLPHLGVAVLAADDTRDYAAVAAEQKSSAGKTLYDRIKELPEQTWH